MSDLRGRINSLREEICEASRKDPEEIQPELVLKLCRGLEKLVMEYISSGEFSA